MRTLGWLVVGAVGAAVSVAACGDDEAENEAATSGTTTTSAGSGGSGGGEGGAGGGATGGEGGSGGMFVPMCVPTPGKVFALNKLHMGDKNPDGTESDTAWMQYGFDLDNKTTTPASTDVCQPANGGSKNNAYPDGNDGIDNSFGRNVLPSFLTFQPMLTESVNNSLTGGGFTMMLRMDDLVDGPDTPAFETLIYGGAGLGSQPKFDGTDCWPVLRELLSNPMDIDSSTIVLPDGSVTGDVWTSGAPGTLNLTIPAGPGTLNLIIHAARISMVLDPDHSGATQGLLGGVLETNQFAAEVQKLAGAVSPIFCSGPIIDGIIDDIKRSSDIMVDGTQNPASTCNGISIGLGFTAKSVQLGGVAPKATPAPDPCAM